MLIDNIIANASIENQEYRIFLCKTNKEVIRELTAQSFNPIYSPQLGGCDAFSFKINRRSNGSNTLNYENIIGGKLIKIQQKDTVKGYFEIQDISIENDGITETKSVACLELEIKLINKQLYLTTGTFKLLNNTNPSNGLLNLIVAQSPSWTIGTVDSSLLTKERYFDMSATNCYELLLGKIQESFECIITFDSVNGTINAYKLSTFGAPSPIIVSLDNIAQSADIDIMSKEIVNKLSLFGDNELSVYDVNLGQSFISNLSYFKTTEFISQTTIDAMNLYDAKVNGYIPTYQSYISQILVLETSLVTLNSELLILQGQLSALEIVKSYNISIGAPIVVVNANITAKNVEITTKTNQINTANGQVNNLNASINTIMTALNTSTNFTVAQLKEIDSITRENVYQDSSYLATDSFTYAQKIEVENQLLEAGKAILARTSYPRYKIKINMLDFLKNKEFAYWHNKLHIGDIMDVRIDDTFIAQVRVTGYTHDWDNNNLEIQFGDKYQFDDANIQLLDLLKKSISSGTSVDFNKYKWQDTSSTVKNEVTEFINSSLNIMNNSIVSGTGIGITMDERGFLATRTDPSTGILSPNQLRISNNGMAISDDGFNTSKLAIGVGANGQMCVIADVIAGKMILGNQMIIQTNNGDFKVDDSGLTVTKMALNMNDSANLKNILIDPVAGFTLRTRPNVSSNWETVFFVDTNGNLQLKGNLLGASGTFTGALSGATGTFVGTVNAGSFIGGNINIGSGKFFVNSDGTMSATNAYITGTITGSAITGSSMTSGTATFGTDRKVKLYSQGTAGVIGFLNTSNIEVSNMGIDSVGNLNLYSSGDMIIEADQLLLWGSSIGFNNRPNVNGSPIALYSEIPSIPFVPTYASEIYSGGHNHGIADGTVLRKADGGTVTWVAFDGYSHGHWLA